MHVGAVYTSQRANVCINFVLYHTVSRITKKIKRQVRYTYIPRPVILTEYARFAFDVADLRRAAIIAF